MSAAELKDLRNMVKEHIDHADELILKKVYNILEASSKDAEWWHNMPEEIKAEVEDAIKEADSGVTLTHDEVRKKHPQWFTK